MNCLRTQSGKVQSKGLLGILPANFKDHHEAQQAFIQQKDHLSDRIQQTFKCLSYDIYCNVADKRKPKSQKIPPQLSSVREVKVYRKWTKYLTQFFHECRYQEKHT